jgi:RimJ/RimL family protein N-acetyltransferase
VSPKPLPPSEIRPLPTTIGIDEGRGGAVPASAESGATGVRDGRPPVDAYGVGTMAEIRFPSPPLGDDVVLLRQWRETDVPAMLDAFSDPLFESFSDWAPRTEADAHVRLVEYERARKRGEQVEFALAEPREHAVVLGGAALNGVDLSQRRAAVGYWLAPSARGRGVATHAVRLIARWAFDELGLERLELNCGPDNRASQRVADRCGFTREGTLRSHMPFKGGRRDTVVFGLLPGELR